MTSLPRGLRKLIRKRQEDLDDQAENFIDFEQGLDWILGWPGMRARDKLQKGRLRLSETSLG
jgi:hypothetical protein